MVHTGDDDLLLDDPDREKLHSFVAGSMRRLGSYRIVYERRCLYSDTFDRHFLIDRHPEADNLTVAAGGSGHAFKMAPVLGAWIADAAAGYRERVPSRFHWRKPVSRLEAKEEARFTDY